MKKILLMMGLSIASFVATAQTIYTLAGKGGLSGNDGNGGLATAAHLTNPKLVCKDAGGNIYFNDIEWGVLRKVDVAGIITEVASDSAINAGAMCIDAAGNNIYWSSIFEGKVYKLNLATGINTTVVGGGNNTILDDNIHLATQDDFNLIRSLCIDANDNLFVSTSYGGWGYIFKVSPNGSVSIYLGTPSGVAASPYNMNDISVGDSASRVNYYVGQMCIDNANNIYFIEGYSNTGKKAIRKIAGTYPNMVTRIANTGSYGAPSVYSGNGGLALNAEFDASYIAVDANSNLYVSSTFRVLSINAATHIIKTVAGTGTDGYPYTPTIGDGAIATNADINPKGICADANGANVYFGDPLNLRVRRVFTATTYNNGNISCPIRMLGTTGANNVCVGNTVTLTNATVIPTGATATWKSIVGSASINAVTGIATGVSAGTALIKYTVSLSAFCKRDTSFYVTVNPIPVVPTIVYAPNTPNPQVGAPRGSYCVGKIFTVQGTPNIPAGVWSSTGALSISSLGVVTINAVGNGSVKYTYTSAGGCVNSRTMIGNGFSCAARGINNNEQLTINNEFVMFPNPAKSTVNLSVDNVIGNGSIIVTDLYGKIFKNQPLSIGTNTIDIVNLVKGFYLVSVITSSGKSTKKLIVE